MSGRILDTSGRTPGRVGRLIDGFQTRESFQQNDGVTRSELAEEFVEQSADYARRYAEIEEASRPAYWNDYQRDWESQRHMAENRGQREAWAEAIDLLWTFSDGEDMDADALREALTRKSMRSYERAREERRHSKYWFVLNARESAFSRASTLVREAAGLESYSETELDMIRKQYHRGSDFEENWS